MTNTNQLSVFDFKTNEWTLVKTTNSPPNIDSHKSCVYGNQMIVGLGYSENQYNAIIYSLNLDTFVWSILFNPKNNQAGTYHEARAYGSLSLYGDSLVIYGGKNFYDTFSDMWRFDLK